MIISIDPSKTKGYGYAVWDKSRVIECGKFVTIQKWMQLVTKYKPEITYIEDQYLYKNFKTAKFLIISVGRLIGILDLKGLPHQLINPATWQSRLGILDYASGEKYSVKKRKRSEKVISMANIFVNVSDDDVACAVLIAYSMRKDDIDERIINNFTRGLSKEDTELANKVYDLLKFAPMKKTQLLREIGMESKSKSPNALDILSSILPLYQDKGGMIGLMINHTLT